jgi:hypothetical protein
MPLNWLLILDLPAEKPKIIKKQIKIKSDIRKVQERVQRRMDRKRASSMTPGPERRPSNALEVEVDRRGSTTSSNLGVAIGHAGIGGNTKIEQKFGKNIHLGYTYFWGSFLTKSTSIFGPSFGHFL